MPHPLTFSQGKQESGFTLVELLVVILIIGVLAAIAIPAFMNQRQRANDASVESDVRNIAMMVHDAEIACADADGYYFRNLTGGNLNDFSWTKSDGTILPISPNTHTISADYIENNRPAVISLSRNSLSSDTCSTVEPVSLSSGNVIHLTYTGDTTGNLMSVGEFAVYGWNPNGAEYNGDTLNFTGNKGEFNSHEESSVYAYKSQEGGTSGN